MGGEAGRRGRCRIDGGWEETKVDGGGGAGGEKGTEATGVDDGAQRAREPKTPRRHAQDACLMGSRAHMGRPEIAAPDSSALLRTSHPSVPLATPALALRAVDRGVNIHHHHHHIACAVVRGRRDVTPIRGVARDVHDARWAVRRRSSPDSTRRRPPLRALDNCGMELESAVVVTRPAA